MDSSAIASEEQPETLTGYALVADLMRRQDEAIAGIDELNLRIEAAIREITDARTEDDTKPSQVDSSDVEPETSLNSKNAA